MFRAETSAVLRYCSVAEREAWYTPSTTGRRCSMTSTEKAQERATLWSMAARAVATLVKFLALLLGEFEFEELAALGRKKNAEKLALMAWAVRQLADGHKLIIEVPPTPPSCFERLTNVKVGCRTVKRFVVAEEFVVGTHGIAYLNPDFQVNFLTKMEENVEACDLYAYRLTKDSLDEDIKVSLGGTLPETAMAHLLAMIHQQADGQKGNLLVDGKANIFYCRGANGGLWAVRVCRYSGGWRVYAYSVTSPNRWSAGYQVFARGSR